MTDQTRNELAQGRSSLGELTMLVRQLRQVVDHPCINHWHVGTTMRYVTPSATFIEDAYRRAISKTLADLVEEEEE